MRGLWRRNCLFKRIGLVGGSDAVLVIDDTAIPKKGTHSVGVAAQYASALGKSANWQTLVSLTLARGEVPVMLALRLFLPESWTSKRARLERAGVPTEYRTARTKPEMALAEIDRVIAAGVRFACVLADAGYGLSAPFRQGLTARKLAWAVGIPRHLKVYPADVQMIWPVAGRGRPRKRHGPDILSMAAEDMLADATWQNISWRTGTKGKLKARFAAVRVRIADGPPQRIRDKGQQHLPGEEAWLIGEHRMSGEKKHYLANLPAKMDLRTLAATIKARWICEQAHQQLKEELGLDHFEGRSWQGLHRHALMTMIAYAFLQHRRLAAARREKKEASAWARFCYWRPAKKGLRGEVGYRPLMAQEGDMRDQEIRAALDRHWAASDANDFEAEHSIYREDMRCWNTHSQASESAVDATYRSHALSSRVKSVSLCGESLAAVIFGSPNTS